MALGSILAAVAGPLVSGLFGSKSKTQTTTTKPDLVGLVKEAQAAGFNPLTALRNGAAGGTTTTTLPGLSSAEFIGDALNRGLTAWSEQENVALQREMDILSRDILREELNQLQQQGRAIAPTQSFGYAVPQATTYGGGNGSGQNGGNVDGALDGRQSGLASYRLAGTDVLTNPHWSDAEVIEQRHGDIASSLYGLGTLWGDFTQHVERTNPVTVSDPGSDPYLDWHYDRNQAEPYRPYTGMQRARNAQVSGYEHPILASPSP